MNLTLLGVSRLKTRELPLMFLLSPLPLFLGCSGSQELGFDEAIHMGPFEFQVERAFFRPAGDGHPVIIIEFEVVNDASEGDIPFGDYMDGLLDDEGKEIKSMAALPIGDYLDGLVDDEGRDIKSMAVIPMHFPHMAVMDSHGHRFVGIVKGRPGQWWGEFIIWGLALRRQDAFDQEHRVLPIEDFTLVIENPHARQGQPHSVSVALGDAC